MYKRIKYGLKYPGTRFLSTEKKNYSVPNGFHLKTFRDVTNSQLPGNSLAEKWLTTGSDYSEKKKQVVIAEVVDLKSRLD